MFAINCHSSALKSQGNPGKVDSSKRKVASQSLQSDFGWIKDIDEP
jgi:hypothetical protein